MAFGSARRETLSQPTIRKTLEGVIHPTKTKSLFYNLNVWYSSPLWASTSISYHPTTFLFVVVLFKPLSKFGARREM